MYIRADNKGNISLVSVTENTECVLYTGSVPGDFFQTVGLSKYQFINGAIVAVSGWVAPVIEPLP